ncbi:hypothetical protein VTN31DRAFT_3846 [Thermomyces dupontii]|uniref:uncharacterized protein n=1 Tax=Talaromyces thermophilus TaxID=28565 RepID=UPI0037429627
MNGRPIITMQYWRSAAPTRQTSQDIEIGEPSREKERHRITRIGNVLNSSRKEQVTGKFKMAIGDILSGVIQSVAEGRKHITDPVCNASSWFWVPKEPCTMTG